ncbi:MAG: hypothetical protein COV47_02280 [Candidatus Diapherotrites archaeon CG11_big_fil_rev_8_21_14_0_20_37_9]|nr:MAG: hypothetical protein COV47_02280 [Candidatus Diapherotrites archaeon CG11_big_fil_rev_8_21_14_0_20_37_9]
MLSKEVQIVFPSELLAKIASKAVSPELSNTFEKRSKTAINTNKNVVSLKVIASDETALKASFNSYRKLLEFSKRLCIGGE